MNTYVIRAGAFMLWLLAVALMNILKIITIGLWAISTKQSFTLMKGCLSGAATSLSYRILMLKLLWMPVQHTKKTENQSTLNEIFNEYSDLWEENSAKNI